MKLGAGWTTGVRFPAEQDFSLRRNFQTGCGAHPVSDPMGTGVKRPGREPNHSPLSSAEGKNAWSYASTPPYVSVGPCLVKHQGQLYLFIAIYSVYLLGRFVDAVRIQRNTRHVACMREMKNAFKIQVGHQQTTWMTGVDAIKMKVASTKVQLKLV
jgi:hypothetical protein